MKIMKKLLYFSLGIAVCGEAALACSVDPNAQMRSDLSRVMNTELVQNQIKRWGGKIDGITFNDSSYWISGNGCAINVQAVYKQMPTPYGSVASCPAFAGVEVLMSVCR